MLIYKNDRYDYNKYKIFINYNENTNFVNNEFINI